MGQSGLAAFFGFEYTWIPEDGVDGKKVAELLETLTRLFSFYLHL